MSLPKGFKLKEVTKDKRVAIRMNEQEYNSLEKCSKKLETSKTNVLLKGLELVEEKLNKE